MSLLRRRVWRYGRRTTIVAAIVVAVLLVGSGSYALFLGGGSGPAASSGSINLSKGLVSWWKMDGNTKDATPYANNATIQGGVTLANDRHNRANSAYGFDGSTGYLSTANSFNNPQVFSMSIWFKTTSTSGGGLVCFQSTQTGNPSDWDRCMWMDNFGHVIFASNFLASSITSSNSYNDGLWHLATATMSSATGMVLYVDGQSVGANANTTSQAFSGWWRLGEMTTSGQSNMSSDDIAGSLDDARVYNRALSAAEVIALYKQYNTSPKLASGENGLIGWWKLQGNAKDATPYANDGFFGGSPTSVADRNGRPNNAYSFSGSQYIAVPNFSANVVGAPGMTLTGWVKPPNNPTSYMGYFGMRNDANADFYVLQLQNSNNLECRYRGTNGTGYTAPTTTITPNVWQMVTIVYTGSTVGCYINAVAGGTTPTASAITNTGVNFDIAAVKNSPGYLLNGSVADVRFYKRALTQTEITNLYNSYNSQISLGGDGANAGVNLQKGLMGYWPLNGNAKDATPYSTNGTVSGATLTNDRYNRANSAYSFNGTSAYVDLPITPTYNNLTVSLWFNASSLSGSSARLLANSHTDVDNKGFELMFRSGGATGFFDVGNGSANGMAGWTQQLVAGQWYHYVGVYDGSHVYAYLNNVQVASVNYSGGPIATSGYDVDIGRDSAYSGDYFSGIIDDVRIYNRALNANEIQALYNEYQ